MAPHKYLEQKISRVVGILAKLKSCLPKPALLKLYYAVVHSHLLYCLAIWGSTFPSYLNKLASLQNKAVKLVAGGKYRDHVTSFSFQINVIKLSDLVNRETSKIYHRNLHSHLPSLLSPLFKKSIQISTRITRAVNFSCSLTLLIPWYSTDRLQRSIMYMGVKIGNEIPLAFKSLRNKQFNLQ